MSPEKETVLSHSVPLWEPYVLADSSISCDILAPVLFCFIFPGVVYMREYTIMMVGFFCRVYLLYLDLTHHSVFLGVVPFKSAVHFYNPVKKHKCLGSTLTIPANATNQILFSIGVAWKLSV